MGQLRPATVEELAEQERSRVRSHRRSSSRPLITALATACLMISGAGAFALARTGPNATIERPYGLDAPFGVDYVDGFGEHTPDPTHRPPTASSRSKRAATAAEPVGPVSSPMAGSPVSLKSPAVMVSPSVVASAPVPVRDVSAVYWTTTWYGNYDAYVWVHNGGASDAAWEVRVKLPAGATVISTMAVQRSYVDGEWVFKPNWGRLLPAGRVYLFAFSGHKPDGRFGLRSCMINGLACNPFA